MKKKNLISKDIMDILTTLLESCENYCFYMQACHEKNDSIGFWENVKELEKTEKTLKESVSDLVKDSYTNGYSAGFRKGRRKYNNVRETENEIYKTVVYSLPDELDSGHTETTKTLAKIRSTPRQTD